MKMRSISIAMALFLCLCVSCKAPQYIPVETIKTEYRDNYLRDSIVRYDSVFVRQKADTFIFERYRYLYKDRFVRDSIFINDTIRVPYPVETVKEVNAPLSVWQTLQLWCGRVALIVVLLVLGYRMWKWKGV